MNALLRCTAGLALLCAGVAAPLATAQPLVIDDFEDGNLSTMFVFSGGAPGVLGLTPETPDGSAFAVQFDVDADRYGGFTGFGQPIDGGAVSITGFQNPVLELDIAATGTFTLEINFQNTGGGGNGEIRNALRFVGAGGTYRRYALSMASFFTTNAASFEFDDVFQYVFTVLDAQGDGNPATNETRLRIDNIRVVEGQRFENARVAFDFDNGDLSPFFFFAGGEGISPSLTSDTPDGSPLAFRGQIDGDEFGGFAGFGATIPGAPVDARPFRALNFFLRANSSAVMEVNLQTGAAVGGNEGRERLRVSDTGGAYKPVSIPLEAFIQSSPNAPNLADVYNVVFTFVGVPGDGNTATAEFQFDIDAVGFGVQLPPVSSEAGPEAASRLVAYPNPSAGATTIAFDLAAAAHVHAEVYDALGRRVYTLASGLEAAGPVRLGVPAGALPPGVYTVRVQTSEGVSATRFTVIR